MQNTNNPTVSVFNSRAAEPPAPLNTQRSLEYGRIFERDKDASISRQQGYSPRRYLANNLNDSHSQGSASPLEAVWTEKLRNINQLHNKISRISTGGSAAPVVRSPTRGSSSSSSVHVQALREKAKEISDAERIRKGELSRTQAAELRAARLGDECETLRQEVRLLKQHVSEMQQLPNFPATTPLEYYSLENDRLKLACSELSDQLHEKGACIQRLTHPEETTPGDYASRIISLEKELQSRPTQAQYNAVLRVITSIGMTIQEQTDAKDTATRELQNGTLRLTEQGETHARQLAEVEAELVETKKSLNAIISKQEHEIRRLESDNNTIAGEQERRETQITNDTNTLEIELSDAQAKIDNLQLEISQSDRHHEEQLASINEQLSDMTDKQQKAELRCSELADKLGGIEEVHKKQLAEIEATANSKVVEAELKLTRAEATSTEHTEALRRMAEKAQGTQAKEYTHQSQLLQKISDLETLNSELSSQLAGVTQERDILQQFTSTLKGTQNEYQKSKELVITLKEQNAELAKQLETAKQQLSFPAAMDNEEPTTALQRQMRVVREASAKEAELLLQLETQSISHVESPTSVDELQEEMSSSNTNGNVQPETNNQLVEELKWKLQEAHDECHKLRQDMAGTQQTAAIGKRVHECLMDEKDQKISELSDIITKLENSQPPNGDDDHQWKLRESEDECHKLKQELATAQQAVAINKKVQEVLIEEKDVKIAELQELLQAQQPHLDNLQQQIQEQQSKIAQLEETPQPTSPSPEEMAQLENLQWRLKEAEDQCHALKQEVADNQQANAISKRVQEELMKEKDDKIAELETSASKSEEADEQVTQQKQALTEAETLIAELRSQSKEAEQTKKEADDCIAALRSRLEEADEEAARLQQENSNSDSALADLRSRFHEMEGLQSKLTESENEIRSLKEEIEYSQQQCVTVKRLHQEMIDEKDSTIRELQVAASETPSNVDEVGELQQRIDSLLEDKSDVLDLTEKLRRSQEENDNLRKQTKTFRDELSEAAEQSAQLLKEEMKEVTTENEKLREAFEESKEKLKAVEEELKRKGDLESTLTSLKDQIASGDQTAAALQAVDDEELASLRLEVKTLKEENKELKAQEIVIKRVSTPLSVRSESSFPGHPVAVQLEQQQQKLLQSIELTNEVYKDLEDLNIEVYNAPPADKQSIADTLSLYSEACRPVPSTDSEVISARLNDVLEYLQRCDSLSEDLIKRAEDTQALL